MKSEYELRAADSLGNDLLVAALRFGGAFSSFASGECADGAWDFDRTGFWQTRAVVRSANSQSDLAVFQYNTWRDKGVLELPGSRRYLAATNFWKTRFEFRQEMGEQPLIVCEKIGGFLRLSSGLVISSIARNLPELPWMTLLAWYLTVMMHRDTAAAAEFALKGFDQANINTISIAAGFAKGTIYNYFASKQALLNALIESVAAEQQEYIQAAVLSVSDPAARLERFFQAGFEYVARRVHRARAVFNVVNSADQAQKRYCQQAYQPMFQMAAEQILAPGMQQGVFRPLDLQTAATLLMTIYMGTVSQVDEQGRPWLDPALVANFMLHALQPSQRANTKDIN
jgi:AcrR family transcriptional regulator